MSGPTHVNELFSHARGNVRDIFGDIGCITLKLPESLAHLLPLPLVPWQHSSGLQGSTN